MSKQRDSSDVLQFLFMTMSLADPVGFAFEPIATMSDPDDELQGDYVLRVVFETGVNGEHRYCAVFQASLVLGQLLAMEEDDFKNMLMRVLGSALDFKFKCIEALENGEAVGIGRTGPDPNLGSVIARAHEMMTKVKH